jgi:hypothetical protein
MTEREGTDVPGFLKLAIPVIAFGAAAYFFLYMNGDVNQPERGGLVRAMNAATETSAVLMYGIEALIVAFGVIVVAFAVAKPHE